MTRVAVVNVAADASKCKLKVARGDGKKSPHQPGERIGGAIEFQASTLVAPCCPPFSSGVASGEASGDASGEASGEENGEENGEASEEARAEVKGLEASRAPK